MDQQVLWFILLLPPFSCVDSQGTLVKTIGGEQDSTQICPNNIVDSVLYTFCNIRKKGGEGCSVVYEIKDGVRKDCGSKFRLMTENGTVFLYLENLTPEDSGHYTCECVYRGGVKSFGFNVTVEAPILSSPQQNLSLIFISIGLCTFILISGLVIGCSLYKLYCRQNTRTEASVPPPSVLLSSLDQGEQDDPYESLQQPTSDLYQTISSELTESNHTATRDDGDIYENS